MHDPCTTRDLLHNRLFMGMWVLTTGLVMGQVVWPDGNVYLSPLLLAAWGVFCSANALRCGRVHCRVIGPLCLLSAFILVLMGLRVVRLSGAAFNFILLAGIAGAFVLEGVVGKYGRKAT